MEEHSDESENTPINPFWPKDILAEFIAAYQSLPELWDNNHPLYTNKQSRHKGLEVLVSIYKKLHKDASVGDVRRKLNSLRVSYRKEQRKIESSKQSSLSEDDIYRPQNWIYYALQFLGSSETQCDISLNDSNGYGIVIENKFSTSSDHESAPDRKSPSPFTDDTECNLNSPAVKQKLKREYTADRSLRVKKNLSKKLCKCEGETMISKQDLVPEVLVWVNKLNALHPIQRLYAEKAINDVLFEAQLGNLTADQEVRSLRKES